MGKTLLEQLLVWSNVVWYGLLIWCRGEDLNLPGFNFHKLRGKPKRYTIHVNGPWCITFEFENGEARHVDLEQYH